MPCSIILICTYNKSGNYNKTYPCKEKEKEKENLYYFHNFKMKVPILMFDMSVGINIICFMILAQHCESTNQPFL